MDSGRRVNDTEKLIKRLKAKETTNDWMNVMLKECIAEVEAMSTIEPEPKRGKWIISHIPHSMLWECSECGFDCGAYSFNFCPKCGADMRGENFTYVMNEIYQRDTDIEVNRVDDLIGRVIIAAEVDGFGIKLKLDDGSAFEYDASDGGYSTWELITKDNCEKQI